MQKFKITQKRSAELIQIAISLLTIASILCAVILFLFPLSAENKLAIFGFDLFVVGVLAADFIKRLAASPDRSRFLARHWRELPAMLPLVLLALVNSLVPSMDLRFLYFITFFRLIRLYDILKYFRRNEFIYMSAIVIITLIFSSISAYFVERNAPGATITSPGLALWWAASTMTTVDYGDVVPVTVPGKIIAVIVMITGIGVLWTFVAAAASTIVSKRVPAEKAADQSCADPSIKNAPASPSQDLSKPEKETGLDTQGNSTAHLAPPGDNNVFENAASQNAAVGLVAVLKKLNANDLDQLIDLLKTLRDEREKVGNLGSSAV